MNILSLLLGLPLAPVRGVIRLAEVIQERAEQEMANPARARRELESVEAEAASGEITADEAEEVQKRVVHRMTRRHTAAPNEVLRDDQSAPTQS